MQTQDAHFDAEIFVRTASLFAAKRETFDRAAVEVLANDIVCRLARSSPRRHSFDIPAISAEDLEAFCDALVQPATEHALRFIEARRAEGVTRKGIYLGYITAAARYLGKQWDDDRLSFLQVTIGTGHLYALMRALRAEADSVSTPEFDTQRCALFATVPGEDHGIGITVAADLFREVGWEIDLQVSTDHDALIAHVDNTQPQIVGLSLSREQRLDALARLVVAVRIAVPQAIIGVAPGAGMNANRVHSIVDVDLVFRDAKSACQELERLIWLRA